MLIIYITIFINLYFWSIIGFIYIADNSDQNPHVIACIFWPLTLIITKLKNIFTKIINFLKPKKKITARMQKEGRNELDWDDDGKFITLNLYSSELSMVFSYLPISIKDESKIIIATQELKNYVNKLINDKNKLIEEDTLKNEGYKIKIGSNRKINII